MPRRRRHGVGRSASILLLLLLLLRMRWPLLVWVSREWSSSVSSSLLVLLVMVFPIVDFARFSRRGGRLAFNAGAGGRSHSVCRIVYRLIDRWSWLFSYCRCYLWGLVLLLLILKLLILVFQDGKKEDGGNTCRSFFRWDVGTLVSLRRVVKRYYLDDVIRVSNSEMVMSVHNGSPRVGERELPVVGERELPVKTLPLSLSLLSSR